LVEACKLWQKERRENQGKRRQIRKEQNKQKLFNSQARKEGKRSTPAGARSNTRNRCAEADDFEALAGEQADSAGD
jgi:hypothetical protein